MFYCLFFTMFLLIFTLTFFYYVLIPTTTNSTQQPSPFQFQLANSWMLFTLLFGLGLFFLVLTACYLYTFYQGQLSAYKLPPHFYINTLNIIACSVFMQFALQNFKNTNLLKTYFYLKLAFAFSILFVIIQLLGWQYMNAYTIKLINGNASGGYLYVISGLHLLHILAGVVALGVACFKYKAQLNNEAKYIFSITKPNRVERFQLLVVYVHFVDAVWLYLILFFSIFH